MCGIAGIISNKDYGQDAIKRMLTAMIHRGPDDEGIYSGQGAILGQRRLSIIDLSGGHQPIPNEDKTKWIVANGEIYNYQGLRKELINKGHQFSTESDSEVILHLYEEEGDHCVNRLNGMFSFVIWDQQKQAIFAARDRLGQKPFYYCDSGNELYFASEIKAILAFDPNLAELDYESLDQYLTLRIIASPRSMFRQIKKLPPAHSLSYSLVSGNLELKQYWDLFYEPKLNYSETELVDELESRLIESLKLHMVSDVPVGAFLSGGLDSTIVVSMLMKHVAKEPLQTFSFGLPYGKYNEAPYARMIAEKYGTIHREKIITPSLEENLPDLIWHLDEPSDPLSVCSYLISKFASKHVKVVLGGDGGDELFGGYDRYYGNVYADDYARIPKQIRKFAIGPILNTLSDGGWYKSKAHQLKWLHQLSFLQGGERYAASLSYFYFGREWREKLYGSKMKEHIALFNPTSIIEELFDKAQAINPVDKMLYSDSFSRLSDHPVMISDRMTMAHSLEVRSPFMDHEIAEFTAKIPVDYKVKKRRLRYIQYKLAERYLPDEVLNRPKQGFSQALPYMLRDEYRRLFSVFLEKSELARQGVFQQNTINQLLKEHLNGRRDNGNRLWLLLNAEVWFLMFINKASREDISEIIGSAQA